MQSASPEAYRQFWEDPKILIYTTTVPPIPSSKACGSLQQTVRLIYIHKRGSDGGRRWWHNASYKFKEIL